MIEGLAFHLETSQDRMLLSTELALAVPLQVKMNPPRGYPNPPIP